MAIAVHKLHTPN